MRSDGHPILIHPVLELGSSDGESSVVVFFVWTGMGSIKIISVAGLKGGGIREVMEEEVKEGR